MLFAKSGWGNIKFSEAEAADGVRCGMDLNGSGLHGCGIGTIYLGTGHGRPVRMKWSTLPRPLPEYY